MGVNPENASHFAEIELNVETSRPEYAVIRGYGNLVSPEDVDLSTTLRAGLWLAPAGLGYESDGFGGVINAQTGVTTSDGFITGVLRASGLFNRGGLDSGSVIADVVIAMLKSERHSIIFGLNGGMQKNAYPGEEFDLGSTFGPRAFPLHSFTGDRMFYASGEYRTVVKPDIAGLIALGVAGLRGLRRCVVHGHARTNRRQCRCRLAHRIDASVVRRQDHAARPGAPLQERRTPRVVGLRDRVGVYV